MGADELPTTVADELPRLLIPGPIAHPRPRARPPVARLPGLALASPSLSPLPRQVVQGVYPGIKTTELDELSAQTGETRRPIIIKRQREAREGGSWQPSLDAQLARGPPTRVSPAPLPIAGAGLGVGPRPFILI